MRLRADSARIAASRRWASQAAEREGASPHAVRVIELLVTEAVTNAVIHGRRGGEVVVELEAFDGVIQVSVIDGSNAEPVLRAAPPGATGGQGVMLIDHLSSRWGVVQNPKGKTVWFEVPR